MKNQFIERPATERALSSRRTVYGVGINDADYMTNMINSHGKQITCPYYQKWIDILQRTHSEKYFIRYPTYRGCSVCDEWLLFSTFRAWMKSQDWEGKCLDKDVIAPGNKTYSPENCVFVSQHVNLILTTRKRFRGPLPIGVNKNKSRFVVSLVVNGERVKTGTYKTKEEAAKSYGKLKHDAIMDLASKQTDKRIIDGLKLHAIKFLNCEVE